MILNVKNCIKIFVKRYALADLALGVNQYDVFPSEKCLKSGVRKDVVFERVKPGGKYENQIKAMTGPRRCRCQGSGTMLEPCGSLGRAGVNGAHWKCPGSWLAGALREGPWCAGTPRRLLIPVSLMKEIREVFPNQSNITF